MSSAAPTAMQVTRTDLNPCTVKLDVVCSAEQVSQAFGKAYKQLSKKVRVPGFRPGTAPRAMLEQMLPEEDVYRFAADDIVRHALKDALDQENVIPDGQPSVDLQKLDKATNACEFSAKVPLPPQILLGEYTGLEVERPAVAVTDEDVDRQIEDMRARSGKREAVTGRGIQSGDAAVVNVLPNGASEGRNFMTVAGQTFPEMDAALIGMEGEQIKSVKLTFPDNFQEADWAGATMDVTLTVRSVSAVHKPELDDAFAQSLNLTNVDELRQRMRDAIQRAKEQIAQEIVNEQLLDLLLAKSKIMVADTTWESVAQRRLAEMQAELVEKGSSLEAYAQANNMTLEELAKRLEAEAKLQVERAVIIQEIFKDREMKVTNEDATKHFMAIAKENEIPPDKVQEFGRKFGAQIREDILYRAMYEKVLSFLSSHAKVVDAAAPAPTAPKKPKTKKAADKGD